MTRAVVVSLLVLLFVSGCAGRLDPPTLEGHSIGSFPLTVVISDGRGGRIDDDVERAVYRAIEDWNTVFSETFWPSARAFVVGPSARGTHVVISPVNVFYAPAMARIVDARPAFMGPAGLIHFPVRIQVRQVTAFDEASRETYYYRAFVRELGRTLGLANVDSPYSSGRQLAEHYLKFWGAQPF